ncbi:kinase-like protein [Ceratobasidium sp. AG-I]|nr:kinase-like protein [Ceratobasidium sp. AG-I]
MSSSSSTTTRVEEIFSGGLEESRSQSHCFSASVEQLYYSLVERHDSEEPPESIVIKTAWYGKQTDRERHEFIMVQVEDMSTPARMNYLVLDRNADNQRHSWRASASKDTFYISYNGDVEKLYEVIGLAPYKYLEEISFQPDTPLHLYELVTLANAVSRRYPEYRNLNSSYLFVGIIWECMRLARPSAGYKEALAKIRGKSGSSQYVPSASKIQETYQEFVEKLRAIDSELQKRKMERSRREEIEIVSSEMVNTFKNVRKAQSSLQMFHSLVEHGCTDLSSRVALSNSAPVSGGGSFGDILRGTIDGTINVAIKVLRFQTIVERHKKGLKRVMRESYNWSKAIHPNVQRLMGMILHQERLGMVSLWMDNGNLQQYITKNLDVDRYRLCCGVATGVAYLHGDIDMASCRFLYILVHGDIKAVNTPAISQLFLIVIEAVASTQLNILISHDGVPKLSDFDHSILSESTLAFSATTNVSGGTLRWMAPELLLSSDEEGSTPATRNKQTDIYALGMTILETITGEVPYSEYRYDMGIYRAIDKRKLPNRPQQLLDSNERGKRVWRLLLKCWDRDPAARPDASSVLKSVYSLKGLPAPRLRDSGGGKFDPETVEICCPSRSGKTQARHHARSAMTSALRLYASAALSKCTCFPLGTLKIKQAYTISSGARLKEIFPGGFDKHPGQSNKSKSHPDSYHIAPRELYLSLVEHDDPETPVESIIVKSAWYGKQTKGAQHEFIIVQVEDIDISGLINYLALGRNIDPREHSWRGFLPFLPTVGAKDAFRISLDGDLKKLLKECGFEHHRLLEQLSFPPNIPLHFYKLVALADVASKLFPDYRLVDSSSHLFAGVIWNSIRLAHPSIVGSDNLAEVRGRRRRFRFNPQDPAVQEIYASFVETLIDIDLVFRRRRTVHGDIKALNVLISHDGVPKLSDFDHSILSNPTLAFSATTNPGGGTLRWMAPELLLGSDEEGSPIATRTKQADVYALGMTMLETITGEVPYSEYRKAAGIFKAMHEKKPPNRPQQLLSSDKRAGRVWKLLLKCWSYDPADRPDASLVLEFIHHSWMFKLEYACNGR